MAFLPDICDSRFDRSATACVEVKKSRLPWNTEVLQVSLTWEEVLTNGRVHVIIRYKYHTRKLRDSRVGCPPEELQGWVESRSSRRFSVIR